MTSSRSKLIFTKSKEILNKRSILFENVVGIVDLASTKDWYILLPFRDAGRNMELSPGFPGRVSQREKIK